MFLKKVTINGYKSFDMGESLEVNNTITSIIGKNESGKTNLLNLLGNISITEGINENEFKRKNRKLSREDKVSIALSFNFDNDEKKKYGVGNEITTVNFINGKNAEISGGLSELISKNTKLQNAVDKILEYFNNNTFNLDKKTKIAEKESFELLGNFQSYINFDYKYFYSKIKKWSKKIEDTNLKDDILVQNNIIKDELKEYYSLFPKFYLHRNYELDDFYNCDRDFFEEETINNNALSLLCEAADINKDELKTACLSPNTGESKDAEDRIQEKLKMEIEDEFNKFYKQEDVKIKLKIDKTRVAILIDTSGNSMSFSERSDGLRWYLMLFVSLKANELLNEKVVMLIDEPGVQLHVNAQKKLLELFESLTENNRQLIYTTHSPYMLDGESIVKSRGIDKVYGMSTFINKIYSSEVNTESKLETLTPLLEVIGLDIKHNIGPSSENINLITEGITDFMYIKAMARRIGIDDVYIIPSTGANNIRNIASILIGWGLNFKVILDYDDQGREEARILECKLSMIEGEDYLYVNSIFDEDTDKDREIECLISEDDYKQMGYDKKNFNKTLAAKQFFDEVNNGGAVSEETEGNFKRLFRKLGKY